MLFRFYSHYPFYRDFFIIINIKFLMSCFNKFNVSLYLPIYLKQSTQQLASSSHQAIFAKVKLIRNYRRRRLGLGGGATLTLAPSISAQSCAPAPALACCSWPRASTKNITSRSCSLSSDTCRTPNIVEHYWLSLEGKLKS